MSGAAVDLAAYFERIGYRGPREATPDVLRAVHLAHATRIPFENLDIQLGRPIRIDLESIQAKLIGARRGGYCFEQNTLLAVVLEQLGFSITRLAARVRFRSTRVLPRTHMLLAVGAGGTQWLADVGFGSGGLLEPIPLFADRPQRQHAWRYRLSREGDLWVLQTAAGELWEDLYVFTLEPQLPIDYELANYYVSTHTDSRFVQTLAVQRSTTETRYQLRNRELTIVHGQDVTVEAVDGDEALLAVLAETFGLEFPAGTRFRCLQGSEARLPLG